MIEITTQAKSLERYLIGYFLANFLMIYLSTLLIDSNEFTQRMLTVALVFTAFLIAIALIATRKRKNWARWVLVVHIGWNCLSTAYGIFTNHSMERGFVIGFVGVSLLGLACAFLLFLGDGMNEWFGQSYEPTDRHPR